MPAPQRVAEVREVTARITHWAAGRPDIVGLLLVGSYARNAARPDSDIDIVLLTTDRSRYADDAWADGLALGELVRIQAWGPSPNGATPGPPAWRSKSTSALPTGRGPTRSIPARAASSPTAPAGSTTRRAFSTP
ncbi:nucleotidyltransferase domain-containing protein [Streptomyces sp. NPDC093707]|uniref:nucleotidyltransferase domain-containing protein n=1 Tax=Streptomyces sp. NPDC093707 TaxID=3154984 RepID=UPI00344B73FA